MSEVLPCDRVKTGLRDSCNLVLQFCSTMQYSSGTYMAWLSSTSASARLTHATVPYMLVSGVVIASNWESLISGSLLHPIDLTETGQPPPSEYVSTDTSPDASPYSTDWYYTCADFTITHTVLLEPDVYAGVGFDDFSDFRWTQAPDFRNCQASSTLYCFEQ
jgi:hypothetical protein